jgi:glycosyl transferase family 25
MENIDRILYINLEKRTDRKKDIENELQTHLEIDDYSNKVERFNAILNEENGCVGCTSSHLEVLKLAKRRGYKYIIIFEDDFQFLVSKREFADNINKLFELVNTGFDFKVVMLSYNAMNRNDYNEFLDITNNVQTASGYLVNCNYLDMLISCLEEGERMLIRTGHHWKYINDQIWKKLQGDKWYLFKQRIGRQKPGYSDLGKAFCDHNC